jgi:nicotinamidase/pyrazinamidase
MAGTKMALWEVDAQADFMLPGGKLYVPGAEKIIPDIKRLVEAAGEAGAFLVSSRDAHAPDDPEFARFPAHCVGGTPGAQILPEGMAKRFLTIPNDTAFRLPPDALACAQIVIEKQTLDAFDNPHAGELVGRLNDEIEFAVFGVATEYCVRLAAKGLLARGRKVALVKDAIEAFEPEAGRRAVEELQGLGARLTTTDEAIAKIRGG